MRKKEDWKKAVLAAALFLAALCVSACAGTKEFSVLSRTKERLEELPLQETKASDPAAQSAVSGSAAQSAAPRADTKSDAESASSETDMETTVQEPDEPDMESSVQSTAGASAETSEELPAETPADMPQRETQAVESAAEELSPEEPSPKETPPKEEPLSYDAYRGLFEAMDPSVRAFYWEVYEAELRSALTEEEYARMQAFALAETTEGESGEKEEREFDREAAEEAFACQNRMREEAGLAPLVWDEEIYRLACSRVSQAAENFSHEGCPAGYGENLASGSAGDGAQVMERLYASEEHRANILGAAYTRGAIACSGGLWVAMYHE